MLVMYKVILRCMEYNKWWVLSIRGREIYSFFFVQKFIWDTHDYGIRFATYDIPTNRITPAKLISLCALLSGFREWLEFV